VDYTKKTCLGFALLLRFATKRPVLSGNQETIFNRCLNSFNTCSYRRVLLNTNCITLFDLLLSIVTLRGGRKTFSGGKIISCVLFCVKLWRYTMNFKVSWKTQKNYCDRLPHLFDCSHTLNVKFYLCMNCIKRF